MDYILDFEKPIIKLENQIKELKDSTLSPDIDISREISALQSKVEQLINDIYSNLGPWERVQLSRHPLRPHAKDYIEALVKDFREIAGDRCFGNDLAMVTGLGHINDEAVAIIGIEKGRKTKEKILHNFGMPRPEGYRKALRVMKLAERFKLPIITFVDTPGAYPGIDAEERGQAQAIAENIAEMFDIKTPILSIIIGEGGSGGALGIAVADLVFMLEYSIYSVISPESCASILWSDSKKAEQAAKALQLDPKIAEKLEIIDGIIKEPIGGAHRYKEQMFSMLEKHIKESLLKLKSEKMDNLLQARFRKYRKMGNSTLQTIS